MAGWVLIVIYFVIPRFVVPTATIGHFNLYDYLTDDWKLSRIHLINFIDLQF